MGSPAAPPSACAGCPCCQRLQWLETHAGVFVPATSDRILTFTTRRPQSLKNRRQLAVDPRTGRPQSRKNRKQQCDMEEIRLAATVAARGMHRGPGSVFGRDDIGFALQHNHRADTITMSIWSAGPEQKPNGRKCDLPNLPEIPLDALEGIAFDNDRQVSRGLLRRDP